MPRQNDYSLAIWLIKYYCHLSIMLRQYYRDTLYEILNLQDCFGNNSRVTRCSNSRVTSNLILDPRKV